MSVSALDSSLTYQEPSLYEPVGDSDLNSEDFMNLLITQLQNQDPLEPMDTNEMSSQMAEFSTMEATNEMADNMEKLLEYQMSQNNLQLLTLIGSETTVSANMVGVEDGSLGLGEFSLSEAVDSCQVEIYDEAGNIMQTVDMGRLEAATTYQLQWEATDASGEKVEDGAYLFVINALTSEGEQVGVEYQSSGTVTGIDFSSGTAMLTLDNAVPVEAGAIVSVSDGNATGNG